MAGDRQLGGNSEPSLRTAVICILFASRRASLVFPTPHETVHDTPSETFRDHDVREVHSDDLQRACTEVASAAGLRLACGHVDSPSTVS